MYRGVLTAIVAVLVVAWLPRAHAQSDPLPAPVARALAQAEIPDGAAALYEMAASSRRMRSAPSARCLR